MDDEPRLRGLESLDPEDRAELLSIMQQIGDAEDEQEGDGSRIAEAWPKPWWASDG